MALLTVREAAAKARISQSLLYDLCAKGLLPHIRIGRPGKRGCVRIDSVELEAFLQGCRVEGPPDGPLTHIR
jgi:excisionase family DNA binding protein